MCKSIFTMAPAAMLLLAGSTASYSASNAQTTITANIVASTCDVSVSTPTLDLGSHPSSSLSTALTLNTNNYKSFSVGLSNCQTPVDNKSYAVLTVTGPTLAGHPSLFNSMDGDAGIILSRNSIIFKNGTSVFVATPGDPPAAEDINNKSINFNASITAKKESPAPGQIVAPILFTFAWH